MNISKLIKQFRKREKLTQTELAIKLSENDSTRGEWGKQSQSRISGYELGTRSPSVDDLYDIASALNVDIVDFFTSVEDRDSPRAVIARKIPSLTPAQFALLESQIELILLASQDS